MRAKEKEIFYIAKSVAQTVLGSLILSFGTALFVLPYGLITGGVSGLAIVFADLFHGLSTESWIAILTWSFFLLGFVTLGKSFAVKTLISSVVYPLGVALFTPLLSMESLGGFLNLHTSQYAEISVLLAALFGGCLVGAGCAITFLAGGSTGGVDIISLALCKWFPRLKSSKVIFFVDAAIISLGMLSTQDFALSLLGILSAFVSALVIDKLFLGASRAFIANVFSDAQDAIVRDVIDMLHRTCTIVDTVGAYSKRKRKMLMITFPLNQYNALLHIIHSNDKNAFVTIHSAHEINGDGWTFHANETN